MIVFAVGNDNREMGNDESAIAEVISVGATDKMNVRAWYSNYGKNLDLLAPGGDYDFGITTLDPSGEKGISVSDQLYFLVFITIFGISYLFTNLRFLALHFYHLQYIFYGKNIVFFLYLYY